MKKQLSCVFLLLVAGCQVAPVVWDKPGVTQEEFNMDSAQCNNQAFSLVGAPMVQRNIVNQTCMQGKGYTMISNN
jgi:hypothetical protein